MRPFAFRRLPAPVLASVLALGFAAAPVHATINAASTLDGPSADVIGVDGVAMSEDGTGGLVYSKRVDGRVHVFVSRYVGRRWQPPQRVDLGQRFDSSWPAIGAGDGGRLVVTWIHQYGGGVQNRMFSASLDPGANSFQAPIAIDLDVREGLDAAPSLSMGPGGVAYLAYRVVYQRQSPTLPPDTVDADIRLQRYSGSFWSQLGQPVDRIQSQPQTTPTDLNGPQVRSDGNGNAVVAWIEPDDQLIPRVYARRVFGQVLGNVLPASPTEVDGKPLRSGADQVALAVAPFGETIVGFRQQPDAQGSWTRPRLLVNMLPSSLAEGAGTFLGFRAVDGGGADGPAGTLGTVNVSVDDGGSFDAGVSLDTQALDVPGDEGAVGTPSRLDDGSARSAPNPFVARGTEGSLAAAWTVDQGSSAGVGLFERRADGTPFQRIVSGARGGAVSGLRFSGSPLGSALVGFLQGREDGKQIVAASIDAPPSGFMVYPPLGWTRARTIPISWDRAHSASGGIRYAVQVDGEEIATGLTALTRTLRAAELGDGNHELTVVATDAAEQTTTSIVTRLKLDRSAPVARVRALRRRRLRTTVSDGVRSESSGLASVAIAWGDGTRGRGRSATHRYRRRGRYTVRVTMRDKVGNRRTLVRKVVVR
ncbi:PKD domain-containing protein [Conexibacter sp. CPCC 206217]|uniref:PKD domain-containing protein n=1 Tax=Conexibacter sp. CPCC 206217 TaxID=3064574 RepID=UPI00271D267A|nr:PKD domain-containing protein [Conexibacter sp. CPCC 206217]MDO8212959.1 PKD domain-containing protein [Conexibacter sp. CPCC 206217]